jgi:hypothetical protein
MILIIQEDLEYTFTNVCDYNSPEEILEWAEDLLAVCKRFSVWATIDKYFMDTKLIGFSLVVTPQKITLSEENMATLMENVLWYTNYDMKFLAAGNREMRFVVNRKVP